MKKLLLFIFLISGYCCLAQQPEIYPYYPSPVITSGTETQITYFDLNFVALRIQEFASQSLEMTLIDNEYNIKDGKGDITYIFEEKIVAGSRTPYKLNAVFSVEPLANTFVIKSLKINGDSDKVLSFYVGFWNTTINFDDLKKKGMVYNRYLQDKIEYHFNSGNPYIEITNTSIKDFGTFATAFKNKELSYKREDFAVSNSTKTNDIISDASKLTELKKDAPKRRVNDMVKAEKKKNEISIINDHADKLQKVSEFLKEKKDGTYDLRVTSIYQEDKHIQTNIEVIKFTPRKSLGEKIGRSLIGL